jgi:hypothetical protein
MLKMPLLPTSPKDQTKKSPQTLQNRTDKNHPHLQMHRFSKTQLSLTTIEKRFTQQAITEKVYPVMATRYVYVIIMVDSSD